MVSLDKYLNNNRTDKRWWQKNYFFATTIFVVFLNILLFALLGRWHIETDNELSFEQIMQGLSGSKSHWHDCLYFRSLLQTFFAAFSHFNWQHTLLNMLCFAICGIYLERKTGSIKLLILIIALAFFGNCAVAANNNSINFYGYSGVNYALYAYVLVDYLFLVFPKGRGSKFDIVSGAVMLALIYFAMCFCGGTQSVRFTWYPYDAMKNLGHYTSYFVGLIIATDVCLVEYLLEKKRVVE